MADYIDRKALIEKIRNWYGSKRKTDDHCCNCWVDDMIGEIENVPAVDAVKVVRCKDCGNGEDFAIGKTVRRRTRERTRQDQAHGRVQPGLF